MSGLVIGKQRGHLQALSKLCGESSCFQEVISQNTNEWEDFFSGTQGCDRVKYLQIVGVRILLFKL